ncbi:hypothetical protein Syun_004927 [Stephania yunnanensis]|uniref:Cytochrome P450 n=1 Tax=Stephania yunnanensis TaxID=152371 RepID=A0AAP0L6H1_9MAGN
MFIYCKSFMEALGEYFQLIACTVFLALITIYFIFSRKTYIKSTERINGGKKAPEPGGAWPIIGHLHLFGAHEPLHQKLGTMADKLGPVFMIRLGMRRAVVVSNYEVAKECFTINDRILATRPRTTASKLMGYNYAVVGISPYGPYWREARKIATLELLSNHRLELLEHIRISEIDSWIKELKEICMKRSGKGPVLVELDEWFNALTLNIMVRYIAGKRYFGGAEAFEDDESQRWKKVSRELSYLFGILMVSDAFPILEGIDVQGYERAMKKVNKEMDFFLSRWLEEHRRRKREHSEKANKVDDQGEQDFIDVMLNTIKDAKIFDHNADTMIKATCMALVVAGNDTTMITLSWAVSLLLNNRRVLKKAKEELKNQIGKDGHVEKGDIENLPYLHAIVKETLRLYPAAPLLLPHEAMEDCTVAGFHVPAGTSLFTNIWKLHRDPNIWPNPLEFKPERFLTTHSHVNFRGQHFELIPFGSGRRMCPGISFAINVLHLTLARLLHEFELETPDDAPVDMNEGPGVTLMKANPLRVLVSPRMTSTKC